MAPREIIHISLGDVANRVSTHWLNLEGLASTGPAAVCDPTITHTSYNNIYVPRALLVDNNNNTSSVLLNPQQDDKYGREQLIAASSTGTWNGVVETLHVGETTNPQSPEAVTFQRQASSLAYGAYSRYRVPQQETTYSSLGRHVNWDEEEEEEEEDLEERLRRERCDRLQWEQQVQSTQDSLEDFWTMNKGKEMSEGKTKATIGQESAAQDEIETTNMLQTDWRDYLMPPIHPSTCLQAPSAPFSEGDTARAYFTVDGDWIETELWERTRKILEECDACQGLTLVHSGGIFAGCGTSLLREWQGECPSKGTFVIDVCEEKKESSKRRSLTAQNRENLRDQVQRVLTISDQSEADVFLPMQLPTSDTTAAAAQVAASLECVTLPYRLAKGSKSRVTLQSYYLGSYRGDSPFGSAPNLSFRELLRSLQRQSSSRNILELSAFLPSEPFNADDLYARLIFGTSLERDHRMRQPGYQGGTHLPQDALPGAWMSDRTLARSSDGLLTSLLPSSASSAKRDYGNRQLHYNFAFSGALRPTGVRSEFKNGISDYTTCLMEGMGIRYRPEQTIATVVEQSLAGLTCQGYGAGSYWKSILSTPIERTTILACLGNSSRVYPFLHDYATAFQSVIAPQNKRSLSRALYNQDVVSGVLPELDDTKEALSTLLDLRDAYQPPVGSGLLIDETESP